MQQTSVPKPSIIIVDDDTHLLASLERHLKRAFTVTAFSVPEHALEDGRLKEAAVVLTDMRMPGMDGITFLNHVTTLDSTIQRMMLTGDADQSTAVEALNSGAVSRFFNKPCNPHELVAGLKDGVRRHALETAERDLLEKTVSGAIRMLVDILSMTQPDAFGMATRLRHLVRTYVSDMGLSSTWALELAAMLWPVGWVAIPPDIQTRSVNGATLTPLEQDMIRTIPDIGADLIDRIPRLDPVVSIMRHSLNTFDQQAPDAPVAANILRLFVDLDQIAHGTTVTVSHVRMLQASTEQTGERYDPDLIHCLLDRMEDDASQTGHNIQEYKVTSLTAGLELLEDIKTEDDKLILAAGQTLTDVHISRLHNFARMSPLREPIMCRQTHTTNQDLPR